MKKVTLGYICFSRTLDGEDKLFAKLAKKKKIKLIVFNLAKKLSEEEVEEKAEQCDIVFNNSVESIALELVKTLEELGKKVIENSEAYYYTEDKWMFYLKCKEHNLPTPNTILLSTNIATAKKELLEFKHWPVVLKRIEGEEGRFVEKANNIDEATEVIKNLCDKGVERLPIIAQEFIKSHSYRVTVVGDKIMQAALKDAYGWKATGVYDWHIDKFPVDKELEKLVKKIVKVCKLNVCGIDFLKKEDKWVLLEINAEPAYDFFEKEKEHLISEILDLLKKKTK